MKEEMEAAIGSVAVTYSGDSIRVTGYDLEAGVLTGTDQHGQPASVKWEDVSVILV